MSMNLHCTGIELYQTPTQITEMCMVQPNGTIEGELTGKKALQAIQIYIQWVTYLRNGIVFDGEELTDLRAGDFQHIAAVKEAIKNSKKFKVWQT